jgi:hypothetical protein
MDENDGECGNLASEIELRLRSLAAFALAQGVGGVGGSVVSCFLSHMESCKLRNQSQT